MGNRSICRRPRRLWVALALVLFGCAGANRYANRAMPSTPPQARSELDELEADISRYRRSIGLPVRPPGRSRSSEQQRTSPGKVEQDASTGATHKVVAPSAPPAAPARASPREDSDGEASPVLTTAAESGRSEPDRCRYTRAICNAANRICRIADYLGDADAKGRCARAQRDCQDARRTTQC